MYVCMCVCVYACVYVCVCMCGVCVYICIWICIYVFVLKVVNYVKGGHYQLACGRYFELTHAAKAGHDDIDMGFSPNHPNQYFDESQKIINGDKKSKYCSIYCYVLC